VSFIRSTSNPEGLYIWHDIDGYVDVSFGGVAPPLASKQRSARIPSKTFFKAVSRWDKNYGADEKVSVGGFTIEERHIFVKTGKVVRGGSKAWLRDRRLRTAFLVRISYRGTFVHLWRVTWQYVVRNAMERLERPVVRPRRRARRTSRKRVEAQRRRLIRDLNRD